MCIILAILIKLSIRDADPQRDFLTLTLTLRPCPFTFLCAFHWPLLPPFLLAASSQFHCSFTALLICLPPFSCAHLFAVLLFSSPLPFPLSPCLVVVVVRYCCCCCPLLLSLRVLHKCNFFILTAHCAPQSFRFRFRLHSRPVTASPPPLSPYLNSLLPCSHCHCVYAPSTKREKQSHRLTPTTSFKTAQDRRISLSLSLPFCVCVCGCFYVCVCVYTCVCVFVIAGKYNAQNKETKLN